MNRKSFLVLIIAVVFLLGASYMEYDRLFSANKSRDGSSEGIPVLIYHHLLPRKENNDPENASIIPVENFEQQMEYLAVNGYKTATLQELEEYLLGGGNLPPKTVVLTFDDGYQSNYVYAYPILKKYGFKATIFLVTANLRENPAPFNPGEVTYLSWPELEAANDVFSYQSHSHSLHWEENQQAAIFRIGAEDIKGDLVYSSQILGARYFAYPFGAYDQRAKELLTQAGYTMAFTTRKGIVRPGDDPLELKRLPVFNWTKLRQFVGLINRKR